MGSDTDLANPLYEKLQSVHQETCHAELVWKSGDSCCRFCDL